jgi:hypothetical protein
LAKSDQFSDGASPCLDSHIQTITVRTVSIKRRPQQVRRSRTTVASLSSGYHGTDR